MIVNEKITKNIVIKAFILNNITFFVFKKKKKIFNLNSRNI